MARGKGAYARSADQLREGREHMPAGELGGVVTAASAGTAPPLGPPAQWREGWERMPDQRTDGAREGGICPQVGSAASWPQPPEERYHPGPTRG
eukprot:568580-Prorocentrum_minimum.AAC.1